MLFYLFSREYTFYKAAIIFLICIFKYLEEVSDVYYGVLQRNGKLYKVGQFQFLKSIINVILFFLILKFNYGLLSAIITITIINLFFIIFLERRMAIRSERWIKIFRITSYNVCYTKLLRVI